MDDGVTRHTALGPAHGRWSILRLHCSRPKPLGERSEMTEPLVGVVMGSASDWETMQHCAAQLEALGVPFETRVLSAHRTPKELAAWVEDAESRGVEVFIAAAGMAAALPGVVA